MALYDDKKFLLSHIKHSFITGDENSVCELVMLEVLPHRLPESEDYEFLQELAIETKSELDHESSLENISNIDMMSMHRRRTNTAQRLDRLKLEKKNRSKVKFVTWKDNYNSSEISQMDQNLIDELFPIKNEKPNTSNLAKKKSLLSMQINKYPVIPSNPFNEYSKYDARVGEESEKCKKLTIYMTMLDDQKQEKPMNVCVLNHAKVQDLIGLICWQYTNQHGYEGIRLESNLTNYCLRIAEENGDIDPDFPCLNANELIGKFGFPTLAIENKKYNDEADYLITIHINQVFTKIEVRKSEITLDSILDCILKKRKDFLDLNKKYVLQKMNSNEVYKNVIDLSKIKEREFKLVFEEDVQPCNELTSNENEMPDFEAIEATLYKSFNVTALHKYSKVDVHLDVSGEKLDITPSNSNNLKIITNKILKVWQAKPLTLYVENIVECELIKKLENINDDKNIFKIIYFNNNSLNSLKFETSIDTANKIVKKIQFLMQMTTSNYRNSYLKTKDQKTRRKSTNQIVQVD